MLCLLCQSIVRPKPNSLVGREGTDRVNLFRINICGDLSVDQMSSGSEGTCFAGSCFRCE